MSETFCTFKTHSLATLLDTRSTRLDSARNMPHMFHRNEAFPPRALLLAQYFLCKLQPLGWWENPRNTHGR